MHTFSNTDAHDFIMIKSLVIERNSAHTLVILNAEASPSSGLRKGFKVSSGSVKGLVEASVASAGAAVLKEGP